MPPFLSAFFIRLFPSPNSSCFFPCFRSGRSRPLLPELRDGDVWFRGAPLLLWLHRGRATAFCMLQYKGPRFCKEGAFQGYPELLWWEQKYTMFSTDPEKFRETKGKPVRCLLKYDAVHSPPQKKTTCPSLHLQHPMAPSVDQFDKGRAVAWGRDTVRTSSRPSRTISCRVGCAGLTIRFIINSVVFFSFYFVMPVTSIICCLTALWQTYTSWFRVNSSWSSFHWAFPPLTKKVQIFFGQKALLCGANGATVCFRYFRIFVHLPRKPASVTLSDLIANKSAPQYNLLW